MFHFAGSGALQVVELFGELSAARNDGPWLAVASFVNPHDIAAYGTLWDQIWKFGPPDDSVPEIPEAPSQSCVRADYVAIVGFCLIATGAYIVMEFYVGFRPEQGQALLARLRNWLDTRTDQVIIIVSLVLGLWLVGKSVYLLVT